MELTKIQAEPRSAVGSNQVARLRADGKVPAVIYGGGGENVPVALSGRELERHLRAHHRVFSLQLGDREETTYLQDVQYDVLTDRPMHLDFKRIDLTKPIHVTVEIVYLGHPVGLGKGGRLVKDMNDVPILCLPTAIPETIELTINDLDLGQKILAKDLPLPQGATLDVDPETLVCHLVVEAAAPEAPAGEEPTEPEVIGAKEKGEEKPES